MEIHIKQIKSISPTFVDVLSTCMLKAGLARAQHVSQFTLGNPKAWLGIAYHAVLWEINYFSQLNSTHELEHEIQVLWKHALENQYQRNLNHPLDYRFGQPESWPGYYLTYSGLVVKIRHLLEENLLTKVSQVSGTIRGIREQEFVAFGGKLKGRPDVVLGEKIIDYKSGSIFENASQNHSEVIKESYIRQLRLYAFLVNENLGYWPRYGILLPIFGADVEVHLDAQECIQEATRSISLLESYNHFISSNKDPLSLSDPSPRNCKWCPYQIICPAFWQYVQPEWSDNLGEIVIEGVLSDNPRQVMNGNAYVLPVFVVNGFTSGMHLVISPLISSIHSKTHSFKQGDRVKIVGLRLKQGNSVSPTIRTIILGSDEIPQIILSEA
jgi:hypothetical protein